MDSDYPSELEIELRMRRADAARTAAHLGYPAHAREIQEGFWDHGIAMTRLAPFFRGVILTGTAYPNRELAR